MRKIRLSLVLLVLIVAGLGQVRVSAQGGWHQWDIYTQDGSSVEASPLGMRKDGRFTRSMDPKEIGYVRGRIDYLAARTKQLPAPPTGEFKQDLVVMLDGKRTFGRVTFKSLKFSEGTITQNGRTMTLENVAYIKFAHPKKKKIYRKHRTS